MTDIPHRPLTFLEQYGRPLSRFLIYTSLTYCALRCFQVKWQLENVTTQRKARLSELEQRKEQLIQHLDQVSQLPDKKGWFW
jgi:hypothetical protein